MQGGLVDTDVGADMTITGTGAGLPTVTGSPEVPTAGGQHQQPTVTVDQQPLNVSGMSPVGRLLAGTTWTREDVRLVVEVIAVVLLAVRIATSEGI